MNYQEFVITNTSTVQVLDGFVGHFKLVGSGCEVSYDGVNFYADSNPITTEAEVRLPTALWLRNSTGTTRTAKLVTWY